MVIVDGETGGGKPPFPTKRFKPRNKIAHAVSKGLIAGCVTPMCGEGVNHMMIVTSLVYAVVLWQTAGNQEVLSEMNDLGMLMLGGFVLAVAAAIGLTVIRLKLSDKKPEKQQFVSISSRDDE